MNPATIAQFPTLVALGLIQMQPLKPAGRPRQFTDEQRAERARQRQRELYKRQKSL